MIGIFVGDPLTLYSQYSDEKLRAAAADHSVVVVAWISEPAFLKLAKETGNEFDKGDVITEVYVHGIEYVRREQL